MRYTSPTSSWARMPYETMREALAHHPQQHPDRCLDDVDSCGFRVKVKARTLETLETRGDSLEIVHVADRKRHRGTR